MSVIIPFQDIYAKAIGLFDDPKITAAYNSNLMQFYKLMYVYLQNSISLFNNPLSIIELIADFKEPSGQMEVFESDGEKKGKRKLPPVCQTEVHNNSIGDRQGNVNIYSVDEGKVNLDQPKVMRIYKKAKKEN